MFNFKKNQNKYIVPEEDTELVQTSRNQVPILIKDYKLQASKLAGVHSEKPCSETKVCVLHKSFGDLFIIFS